MLTSVITGTFFAVALAVLPEAGTTQKPPSANSLSRALSMFAAADQDHDGRISSSEAKGIPVSVEVFAAEDTSKDGYWSRDEFLVFYRHQLLALGQQTAPDLEAEIARLHALKRVEAVGETRKLPCETSARAADAKLLGERFEKAIAEVEAKCAARQATKEDFQRLRNLVILNGRAPDAGASSPATQSATLRTIDALEKRSLLGPVPKDDFESLRRTALATPRPPAGPADRTRTGTPGPPTPTLVGPGDGRQRAQPPRTVPKTEKPARPAPKRPDKEAPAGSRP